MPERDELKSELRQVVDRMLEIQEQLARPEPPPPPPPAPRTWKPRVIKGGLASVAALAPVAFVRSHLGATGVLAATAVVLSLTPSLAPHVTGPPPSQPRIAAPGPTTSSPPLEPAPEPPMEDTEPDTGADTEEPAGPTPEPEPDAATQVIAQAPPTGQPDNEPDTEPGSQPPEQGPPPQQKPRGEEPPPPEEPPEPEPEEPDCSIIRVDLDAVGVCLLPE